ncbi:hypothetical protein SLEP1_g20301 [Rubroshorea leprosula]|uniref:Uncharacterized protein n=1 Tax=Rubroshorea leprosula TaxID=152421 RepID=A0AAV5J286_9ROSI|nr:hypothetical protein SLEP1_g20301 [Rubroshorea leprosula]
MTWLVLHLTSRSCQQSVQGPLQTLEMAVDCKEGSRLAMVNRVGASLHQMGLMFLHITLIIFIGHPNLMLDSLQNEPMPPFLLCFILVYAFLQGETEGTLVGLGSYAGEPDMFLLEQK